MKKKITDKSLTHRKQSIISKELLSAALGIRTIVMDPILEPMNKIGYLVYGSQNTIQEVRNNHKQINIYELAHKCKELAYSQGYIISSGLTPVLGVNKDGWAEVFSSSTPLEGKLNTFKQLSEPEAVFKAAQWVLNNTSTNKLKGH